MMWYPALDSRTEKKDIGGTNGEIQNLISSNLSMLVSQF